MFAVLGVFAASFAESANAQEVQAQVYAPPPPFAIHTALDTSQPLLSVIAVFTNNGADFILLGGIAIILEDGSRTAADGTGVDPATGLLRFNNTVHMGVVKKGDVITFSSPAGDPPITVRVYEGDGGTLFLAEGDYPSATLKAAGELAADEFFLSSVSWTAKTTLAAYGDDAAGYTGDANPPPPNCGAGAELNGGVCVCTDETHTLDDTQDPQICTPPETQTGGDNGETVVVSKDERDFPVVGAIVMGLLIFGLSQGGEKGEFSYSPSFGYSVNESGYSANVGGRMDFRKDEWTLFYTGGQTNANGEFGNFRYSSGGEYKTDFWQTSFSESVQGKTADYDLSLSANLSGGVWSLSPVYRFHSRLEEGESATRNSLNLEGVLRYEDWRITPSAGFGWRRAEDFGDSAKFRLEAVREF